MNPTDPKKAKEIANLPHLNYTSSLSAGLIDFNPKDIAVHGLTTMIKVTAQLQNLRRGHTNQGLVKRISIDQTYEGYANFMADGRMNLIAHDAKDASAHLKRYQSGEKTKEEQKLKPEKAKAYLEVLKQREVDAKNVFSTALLKPKQDTYLTAEWDEMVPFPTSASLSSFSIPSPSLLSPPPLSPPYHTNLPPPQHGNSDSKATAYPLTATTPTTSLSRGCARNSSPPSSPTTARPSTSPRALATSVVHSPTLPPARLTPLS